MSDALSALEGALGHAFRRRDLLLLALTHRSAAGRVGRNNEKLEFLGDAVLNLAISDLLMERFPDADEGDLSKLRAGLVNEASLAEKAVRVGVGAHLRLGRGEEKSGGRQKPSILASGFEALIGAVYLEAGFAAARELASGHFETDAVQSDRGQATDYKTRLQELTQQRFRETPVYRLVETSGPDHAKAFVSEIVVGGRVWGCGQGRSRKAAEQAAALSALARLEREST